MQEMWVRSLGWEDPLEKGMATHFSMLTWRIPQTEEPGGLQSMVSQSRTQLKQLSTHAKLVQRCDAPWLKNSDTPMNVPLPSGSVALDSSPSSSSTFPMTLFLACLFPPRV